MHSVTSNAVVKCFNFQTDIINIGSISAGSFKDIYVALNTPFKDTEYSVCLNWVSPSNGERAFANIDVKSVDSFRIYIKAIEAVSVLQIEWQAFYIPH